VFERLKIRVNNDQQQAFVEKESREMARKIFDLICQFGDYRIHLDERVSTLETGPKFRSNDPRPIILEYYQDNEYPPSQRTVGEVSSSGLKLDFGKFESGKKQLAEQLKNLATAISNHINWLAYQKADQFTRNNVQYLIAITLLRASYAYDNGFVPNVSGIVRARLRVGSNFFGHFYTKADYFPPGLFSRLDKLKERLGQVFTEINTNLLAANRAKSDARNEVLTKKIIQAFIKKIDEERQNTSIFGGSISARVWNPQINPTQLENLVKVLRRGIHPLSDHFADDEVMKEIVEAIVNRLEIAAHMHRPMSKTFVYAASAYEFVENEKHLLVCQLPGKLFDYEARIAEELLEVFKQYNQIIETKLVHQYLLNSQTESPLPYFSLFTTDLNRMLTSYLPAQQASQIQAVSDQDAENRPEGMRQR
jgi:hypothetical protein